MAVARMRAYRATLVARMGAHLALTTETIDSSAWLLAGALDFDPARAQESASACEEHLARGLRGARTRFDENFLAEPELVEQLHAFCLEVPPVQLWRGRGRYQDTNPGCLGIPPEVDIL